MGVERLNVVLDTKAHCSSLLDEWLWGRADSMSALLQPE
jgi:hypothetical protein